ncbi:MAG: hypothetical protein K0Q73_4449 [Paenibacillus sp.]|jgi:hypothetical protein|nr:hypothetical protein [Paenibacillus sp.]
MLDVGMLGLFLALIAAMIGLVAWAGKTVEEGSEQS